MNVKTAAFVVVVVVGTTTEIKKIRTKRAARKEQESFETFVASVNTMMNDRNATTDVTYVTLPVS